MREPCCQARRSACDMLSMHDTFWMSCKASRGALCWWHVHARNTHERRGMSRDASPASGRCCATPGGTLCMSLRRPAEKAVAAAHRKPVHWSSAPAHVPESCSRLALALSSACATRACVNELRVALTRQSGLVDVDVNWTTGAQDQHALCLAFGRHERMQRAQIARGLQAALCLPRCAACLRRQQMGREPRR